jgi:hypothetical protein
MRTVPAPIRRALEHRDGGCRFPGCGLRVCDAHHVRHWADGGETRLGNLVSLCASHHRMVHEGGLRVFVDDAGEICFERPDGQVIPDVPAADPVDEDAIARLEREHTEQGLEIGAWTATPDWHGERLDVGFSVMTMRST